LSITLSNERTPRASTAKWLAIVGVGEDGVDGLGAAARREIERAAFVFGGRRHLELAAALIRGEARPWPTPFEDGIAQVMALRGRPVCVLASGDPFHFGVGATLARHVGVMEMIVIPAASSFAAAAARLGWALQDCELLSLHAKPIETIRPLLHPERRIIALSSDGAAPALIADLLTRDGFGDSLFTVLEAVGGPREMICSFRAAEVGTRQFDTLNLLAIEVMASRDARILPLGAALPDSMFEHDGQITKHELRAITLSALAPRRGQLLWDIGAGSGSVAIEWALRHPSLHAIAVEADPARAERIGRNAAALGVPELRVVVGRAPEALTGLPEPDAIFVGGSATDAGVMDRAQAALPSGGRLVMNAVTLETEAMILSRQALIGGELIRIAIERAAPIGSMTGWRPAMPVIQWCWVKP